MASGQDVPEAPAVGDDVVRAIYFFSPTCPACRDLQARHLPGITARWGERLDLRKIDVTTPEGRTLFQAAMRSWLVPRERFGVPAVFIGRRHLVGTQEIPGELPKLIEAGLAAGGMDWPPIPGLEAMTPAGEAGSTGEGDLAGLLLGALVFTAVAAAMGWSAWGLARQDRRSPLPGARSWERRDPWTVGLAGAGAAVAGYLSWVALADAHVLCGPVGACDVVHASRFGTLFGVPVALLGLAFFVGVGVLALLPRPAGVRGPLTAAVWAGAAFSLYLTGAEIFVIGAVCSWCLASALLSALLLVRVAGPGEGRRPAAAGRVPRRAHG
jgi:uncharacterized membrane protein